MAILYNHPLDRTFHALGDGTRRAIIATLAQGGARSASELAEPFDAAQPTISKHIKVLEKAGLVRREVDGRVHRFELVTEPLDDAEGWIARHTEFWKGTIERLGAYLDGVDASSEDTECGDER